MSKEEQQALSHLESVSQVHIQLNELRPPLLDGPVLLLPDRHSHLIVSHADNARDRDRDLPCSKTC